MWSSRSMVVGSVATGSTAALLGFSGGLESEQVVIPEAFEPGPELGDPIGTGSIPAPRAVAALDDQAGLAQDGEMLGDRGPADLERGGDIRRRPLAVQDELEDRPA